MAAGCFDNSTEEDEIVYPTLVGVTPGDFLGDVPCTNSPGAMRRYTATLYDVSVDPPLEYFPLPSSDLIPCLQEVTFSFVVPEHEYVARIRGYDRNDLSKQSAGSPNAVDDDGQVVAPRWTTECGQLVTNIGAAGAGGSPDANPDDDDDSEGEGGADGASAAPGFRVAGVTSTTRYTVYANYCLPLVDHGPVTDTGVSVSIEQALRDLECGEDSGQIAEFTAELEGSTSAPLRADCTGVVSFSGLEPGADYRINVLGFEQGADEPAWQTGCRATALAGALTPASCDPLRTR